MGEEDELPSRVYRYRAYLASALTGLTLEERTRTDAVKRRIAAACRSRSIHPYLPELKTSPDDFPDVTPEAVWATDRAEALRADLLVFLADGPSTGAGIEFEFARSTLMPVLVVAKKSVRVSKMVLGAPAIKQVVRYSGLEDVEPSVNSGIDCLWDRIVDRRTFVIGDGSTQLGSRIRAFRERRGLSQAEFATELGTNQADVDYLENAPDGASNLSIPGLRFVARVLETSLAELVTVDSVTPLLGIEEGTSSVAQIVAARTKPRLEVDVRPERLTARDEALIRKWLAARSSEDLG